MEFLSGVTEKETLELEEILQPERIGTQVKVNGSVPTIRDM